MITLMLNDSRTLLKDFPDKEYDLLLTDPPYGEGVHVSLY